MEANHDGELVRQHHTTPGLRVSSREGMRYRIQRVQSAGNFTGRVFCCPSSFVSKSHCEIVRRDRAYWIKDYGSTNGTYLNGVKMTANIERELRFGDILGLGVSHLETDPSIVVTDVKYFILKFQQVTPADVELVEFDDEEDDIEILCESPPKPTRGTSPSSSVTTSKPMPPPPPPPIISKPKQPGPLAAGSRMNRESPSPGPSSDSIAKNSTSSNKTKSSFEPEPRSAGIISDNGSMKSDGDQEHNKSLQEPRRKRLKPTPHSSSDDSSDGLGDGPSPYSNKKSSNGGAHTVREAYSGRSTDESSSSDDDDKNISTKRRNKSKSPTYNSYKHNLNVPAKPHTKGPSSSNTKLPTVTARKKTCHLSEDEAKKQKLRKLKREAARKLEALKRKALEVPCHVQLTNIIVEDKAGKYVVGRYILDLLKYEAVIKRVRSQFRASLSENKRKQPRHFVEPHRNSGNRKDPEREDSVPRKKTRIITLSSSDSEKEKIKKPPTKPLPSSSSSESNSESEEVRNVPKKPVYSIRSESESESGCISKNRRQPKSPQDVHGMSTVSIPDVDLPSDRDDDIDSSDKDENETNLKRDTETSNNTTNPVPAAVTSATKPRFTQRLDNAPLPRFAQRAQEKHAGFKKPLPSTSFYKNRENELNKSRSDRVATEREFRSMSTEEQKQARSEKLKALELKKQQARKEDTKGSNNKPIMAKPKVKMTTRNRNQDLMEDIVGEKFKDTDSVIGGVKENFDSNHRPPNRPREYERTDKAEATFPSNPTLFTRRMEEKINDSVKSSIPTPQPSTSFAVPHPVVPIIPPKSQLPTAPVINGARMNLKPGAEVIMSPPPGVGIPTNYREKDKQSSSGSSRRPTHIPRQPFMADQDIYKRMCDWNPRWIEVGRLREEQKKMKQEPPILSTDLHTTMTLTSYVNFQDYFNTYYPLLLCEIWSEVSDENNSKPKRIEETPPIRQSITAYSIKIDNFKKCASCPLPFSKGKSTGKDEVESGDKSWCTITYHAWTRHEHEINSKKNFLTLSIHGTEKRSNRKLCKPIFAFSDFNSEKYDIVDEHRGNCDQRLKKQSDPNFRGNGYRFTETIVCKLGSNFVIDTTQTGIIKRHIYVQSQIKEFRALNELQSTKLYWNIVSPPEIKTPWKPPLESGPVDQQHNMISLCMHLNPEQRSMVKHVTDRVFSNDPELMLMHGPPGTGKTQTLVALIMQLLDTSAKKRLPIDKQRILVCTPSNAAIDEIMRRLIDAKNKLPAGRKLEIIRIGDNYSRGLEPYSLTAKVKARDETRANTRSLQAELTEIENEIEEAKVELSELKKKKKDPIQIDSKGSFVRELEAKKVQLQNDLHPSGKRKDPKNMNDNKRQDVIREAQVICTTLCSSANSQLKNSFANSLQASQKPFLCCIVDEASQTTEPETLLPLVYNVDKLLLVGDPEQLGATVRSSVAETKGYGQSLFSRLYKFYSRKACNPVMMLKRQYRMHSEILKWPNSYCYEGQLQTIYQPPSSFPLRPYYFLNMSSGREHSEKEGQIQNVDEVEMVKVLLDTLDDILVETKKDWTVGVITPYSAQKAEIRREMKRKSFRLLKSVDVDTVDGFQGQEKDIIILSCVRTDGTGFLKSKNRLNVALTRAKHCLYIIGDATNLLQEDMWRSLIKDAAQRDCKFDVNKDFKLSLAVFKNSLTAKLKEKKTK